MKSMVADADEVTQKLSEYGTLNDDEIETIKENGKRREEQIEEIRKEREIETNSGDVQTVQNSEPNISDSVHTGSKYVLCPKCGEKIWL